MLRISARLPAFSIHAPREGSGPRTQMVRHDDVFSIHAPREGSGPAGSSWPLTSYVFYPRSPGGERLDDGVAVSTRGGFSIHAPREGSGQHAAPQRGAPKFFYPRSPGGERQCAKWWSSTVLKFFYPRSPGGERLAAAEAAAPTPAIFYPRSPGGERPYEAGNDTGRTMVFYPRSPGGERLPTSHSVPGVKSFLSTLPGRGAANEPVYPIVTREFSIHAPREGSGLMAIPAAIA